MIKKYRAVLGVGLAAVAMQAGAGAHTGDSEYLFPGMLRQIRR